MKSPLLDKFSDTIDDLRLVMGVINSDACQIKDPPLDLGQSVYSICDRSIERLNEIFGELAAKESKENQKQAISG